MSVISGSLGAVMGSDAQTEAAQTAANAQNSATAMQYKMYQEDVARQKPFYDVGVGAIQNYLKMLNGGYNMKESPSAQYEMEQGTKTLNRQLAARGLLGGPTAAKRLSELSSSVAAKDYNDQYSRLLDALKLGTGASASMGASSNAYSGQLGQAASNLGNIAMNSGAARASLYSGMGGASGSALGAGLRGYQMGKDLGWWGSAATGIGGTAATDAALYDSAAGEGASWALI